jgi:hypothetical protein
MYGIVYGMRRKKTTIYLPDDVKKNVEKVAEREGISEANIIRDAVAKSIGERTVPKPRIPLGDFVLGAPDIAERVDELLDEGFGR